jgi:hypothetical protein
MMNIIFTNNATSKVIDKIKKKQPVVIFIYENQKSRGIYYIIKETKCPILIVKREKVKKNKKKKYKISYINYNNYDIENKEPKEFMDEIKEILFKKD